MTFDLCMGETGLGFMDKIHDVVPMDKQTELLQKLSKGNFTLGSMGKIHEVFRTYLKWVPSARLPPYYV